MSRLVPSDYQNVIELIEAVSRVPSVPGIVVSKCSSNVCGYTCSEIIDSMHYFFPSSTLTDAEICNLLLRGSRSGVFKVVCSTASTDPEVSECLQDGEPLYLVNQSMASVNSANQIYANHFNGGPPQYPSPTDYGYRIGGNLSSTNSLATVGFRFGATC